MIFRKILIIVFLFASGLIRAQEYEDIETFLPSMQVTDVSSDGSNIWIATNGNGIFSYSSKNNSWKQYSTAKENLQIDYFYCITASEDFVWAGSTDGLFILDKKRDLWTKRKFGLGGQLANWVRSVVYDKFENVVWIGRFKYLTKFDLRDKRYSDYDLTIGKNEKSNSIKSIHVDGDSLLWIGTEAGIHKYDKSKDFSSNVTSFFYDSRMNHFNGESEQISVSSILTERNFIWIGLDEFLTDERPEFNLGGLYRFNKKNDWLRFDESKGLNANGVYDLERTGNYIWASLYQFGKTTKEQFGRGLVLIDRTTNRVIQLRDERIPRSIFSIFFDGVNLWLGTENGLVKVKFINKLAQWNNGGKK